MTNDRELANSYRDMESDLRQVRRLTRLACRMFIELSPNHDLEANEELSALMSALEDMTFDLEHRWDESWKAAGGR